MNSNEVNEGNALSRESENLGIRADELDKPHLEKAQQELGAGSCTNELVNLKATKSKQNKVPGSLKTRRIIKEPNWAKDSILNFD